MKYLLDTNVCIRYMNGTSEKVRQKLASLRPIDIVVCSVVRAELFYGVYKSTNSEKNLARLQQFLNSLSSLPFDEKATEIYGQLRAKLEKMGKPIGPYDLQIASIAVAYHLILVTHNVGEFNRIEKLKIEDWEQ